LLLDWSNLEDWTNLCLPTIPFSLAPTSLFTLDFARDYKKTIGYRFYADQFGSSARFICL
jgi:hypothetical protein